MILTDERQQVLAIVGLLGRSNKGEDSPGGDGALEEFPGDAVDAVKTVSK
jgi:hypothetical protein